MNEIGHESGNGLVHDMGRPLPWLQDTPKQGAQDAWEAEFRDLVILDADNRVVDVFNLTDLNLFEPEVREQIRAALLQAAASSR